MSNTTAKIEATHPLVRISDIDPQKNPSFSPNLYRWLRRRRYTRQLPDRYEADGVEYIGFVDANFLYGSRLIGILCNGGREKTWAHIGLGAIAIHRPLWKDYLQRGRCAIDPEHAHHFIDDRFLIEGDIRTCKWCGHVQKREIYTVTEERERWVSEQNPCRA